MRFFQAAVGAAVSMVVLSSVTLRAVDKPFHDAPSSAKAMKNPFEGQQAAVDAGKTVYARNCLACHGKAGKGTGNVPSLVDGKLTGVSEGEVFWFITKGDTESGMPAWGFLPEEKRWQVVSYVEAMASGKLTTAATSAAPAADTGGGAVKDPAPNPPFTDFRYEKPGVTRKITVANLPQPFATKSSSNGAELVARPETRGRWRRPGSKLSCMRRDWTIRAGCALRRMEMFSWRRARLGGFECFAE